MTPLDRFIKTWYNQSMEKICKVCSKTFIPQHNTFGIYCSILCCNKDKHQLIETICAWCSTKFYQRPSDEKRFCSGSCGAKSSSSARSKSSRLKKICRNCQNEFETRKCENNDFCSHPCWIKFQTINGLNLTERIYKFSNGGLREDLGHYVRSTFEANFIRLLKYLHVAYEYEARTFPLGNDEAYTPDLYLPKQQLFIELKGRQFQTDKIEKFKNLYPQYRIKVIYDRSKTWMGLVRLYRYVVPNWELPVNKKTLDNQIKI